MEDKRRSKRIEVDAKAEYRGDRVWQVKPMGNISAGGMFIATDNVEPVGTLIELIFDLGEGRQKPISAKAVVAWSRAEAKKVGNEVLPAGMGLKFIKIFPADGQKFLENLK
jgi:uncharacterized protein (TIGR02266 family)